MLTGMSGFPAGPFEPNPPSLLPSGPDERWKEHGQTHATFAEVSH